MENYFRFRILDGDIFYFFIWDIFSCITATISFAFFEVFDEKEFRRNVSGKRDGRTLYHFRFLSLKLFVQ